MKKIIFVLSCLLVTASISSATLFTTANPIGQGKYGLLAGYSTDSNVGLGTGFPAAGLQGYVGYGITDKLDVYALVGSAGISNLPTGLSITLAQTGLALLYQIMDENAGSPVSVSLGYSGRPTSTTVNGSATNYNQSLVGIGISKIMVPYIPYGGIQVRKTYAGGSEAISQTDITLGSAIAWSEQGAVFIEYTSASVTPTGTATYNDAQLGIGVGYKI